MMFDLKPFTTADYYNFDMPEWSDKDEFLDGLGVPPSLEHRTITLEAPIKDKGYIASLERAMEEGSEYDFQITIPGEPPDDQDWKLDWSGVINEVTRLQKGVVRIRILTPIPEGPGTLEPPEPFWRRWRLVRKIADFLGGR